jgi:hypothetical protein
VAQLTDRPLLITAALKATIEAAVGALRTFRLVFPERFEIMGLDRDVEKLVYEHNAVFVPLRRDAGVFPAGLLEKAAPQEQRPTR